MILPIGDSPNPEGIPYVTYALIAVNVAVYALTLPLTWTGVDPSAPLLQEYVHLVARHSGYNLSIQQILAQTSAYDLLVFRWGYRPADPGPIVLFTSMFLHGGFAHLAGNMLFLWIYGDNVEHRLGPRTYLLYYLGTGAAATLFHAMFAPNSGLPLVGASGAISGVLGFYFLWFPRNRVHLLLFFPVLLRVVVSARTLLGLYVVVQNLVPFLLSSGSSGVAHGAHIGGFLAGLALAFWTDRSETDKRPDEYPATGRNREGVRAAIAGGRWAEAAQAYFSLPPEETRRLLAPDEMLQLAAWLSRNGHNKAALVVYRRQLRDYPGDPRAAEAHVGAGTMQLELGQETAAYQHFLDALDAAPTPTTEAAARSGLRTIGTHQRPQRPIAVR